MLSAADWIDLEQRAVVHEDPEGLLIAYAVLRPSVAYLAAPFSSEFAPPGQISSEDAPV